MAYPTHLAQQEIKTKKILEGLQQQLKSNPITSISTNNSSLPTFSVPITGPQVSHSGQDLITQNTPARVALKVAQDTSFGFFVPQDSSFGNLFLPVLPRFDDPPPKAKQ